MITSEEEFDRLPQTVKMKHDLQDPERRSAVREEYKKEELPRLYPDIREELQLTVEQEGRLFDLLADFQLQHLDLFYTKEPDQLAMHKRIQENEQRRDEALHSLLGADTLQKYRRYQLDLFERQFVARLVRWLSPANALSPEQKSQLMTVLKTERDKTLCDADERLRRLLSSRRAAQPANNNPAQLLEAHIQANEDSLKNLEAESRRLLQHAASFLSTAQLGTLTRMENQELEAQRRSVDSLRAQRTSASSAVQGGTGFAVIRGVRLPDLPDDPEAPS